MKRFWVFINLHYYPSPRLDDVKGTFDTLEEAKAFIGTASHEYVNWYEYVDISIFDSEKKEFIDD